MSNEIVPTNSPGPMTTILDQTALRAVLSPLMTIIQGIEKAREDGKWDMTDMQFFMPLLYNVGPAMTGGAKAFADFKTMSGEQRGELIQWAREAFSLKSANLERKIEAGLAICIEAGAFLS